MRFKETKLKLLRLRDATAAIALLPNLLSCAGGSDGGIDGLLNSDPNAKGQIAREEKTSVLSFELPQDADKLRAEDCLVIRIRALDKEGKATAPVADKQIILSSSFGTIFGSDNCQGSSNTVSWKEGLEFITVSFRADRPGSAEIAADEAPAEGFQVARKSLKILPATSQVAIEPVNTVLTIATCEPLKLKLLNSEGKPAPLDTGFKYTVDLATPDNFILPDTFTYADSACTNMKDEFELAPGITETQVYFSSLYPGPVRFIASGTLNGKTIGGVQDSRILSTIDGKWSTGCIQTAAGQFVQFMLGVDSRSFRYTQKVFNNCSSSKTLSHEVIMNGQIGLYQPTSRSTGATQAVDLNFTDSCVQPASAAAAASFNNDSYCGIKNWAEGVCTPTTGLGACALNSESVTRGDIVRDRIILTPAVTSGAPSSETVTFGSSNLYPGTSLNNENLRSLSVTGIAFSKLP